MDGGHIERNPREVRRTEPKQLIRNLRVIQMHVRISGVFLLHAGSGLEIVIRAQSVLLKDLINGLAAEAAERMPIGNVRLFTVLATVVTGA